MSVLKTFKSFYLIGRRLTFPSQEDLWASLLPAYLTFRMLSAWLNTRKHVWYYFVLDYWMAKIGLQKPHFSITDQRLEENAYEVIKIRKWFHQYWFYNTSFLCARKIARDFQLSMRRTSDELYKQALRKSDEQTDESRVRAKLRKLIAQEDEQMQQERLKQWWAALTSRSMVIEN